LVALGLSVSGPAAAQTLAKQNVAARALAQRIEAAIDRLGCGADVATEESAIQSVIAMSGQDPATVQVSLHYVSGQPNLCANATQALAQVDQIVLAAMRTEYYASADGPGPGTPIGPPDPISAGTADYDGHRH
jgi:hypothetical protein